MAHAHTEINRNDEEQSHDEEQESDPSAAEFMERAIVYWFRSGCTSGEERWDFNIMEIRTKLRVVRGGIRGDDRDGDGVPIMVDVVLMNRQQRRGDSDDDVDANEDPFSFDLLPGGSDGQFGSAARWCSSPSRNNGGTSASRRPGILHRTLGFESAE